MKLKIALPLIALAMLAACNKAAAPATGDAAAAATKPVATVNGEAISRETFDFAAKNLAGKAASELTADQRNELLDSLINADVVAQQAAKDGLDKKSDVAAQLSIARLQILQQAAGEAYLKDKTATEAELKAEYDAGVAQMPKFQYKAHHILVKTEAEAQAVLARLKKGEKFEAVAKAVSLDSSGKAGGDLGDFFNASSMVPPFAAAITSMKKGEVSQAPVQTQYGYHIIRLDDLRPNAAPPYDSVKSQLEQIVKSKKFKSYADGLLKTAKVEKSL